MSDYLYFDKCPLCGSSDAEFFYITDQGTHFTQEKVYLCGNCALVFLSPRMSRQALRRYYLTDSFSSDFRGGGEPDREAIAYRDLRAQLRWNYLSRFLPAGTRLLEVGCSSGSFLKLARQAGGRVTGIDPSTGYAEHARRIDLPVHVGEFPQDLPSQEDDFDAIASFHVIEHVDRPLQMLREMKARLRPQGILILEYPDVARAALRPRLTPAYFQKSHLHDFCIESMTLLLRCAGFEVSEVFTQQEQPYDKNVLLIARQQRTSSIPQTPEDFRSERVDWLRRMLHEKLAAHEKQCVRPPRGLFGLRRLWRRRAS